MNFDTYARGRINTWRTEIIEARLKDDARIKSYKFLNDCDELIEKIRVPRGKIHNMVRKQRGKRVDSKLIEYAEKFDEIFNGIQNASYDFVKELDNEDISHFNGIYDKYSNRIKEFGEMIPTIRKSIREFGIY